MMDMNIAFRSIARVANFASIDGSILGPGSQVFVRSVQAPWTYVEDAGNLIVDHITVEATSNGGATRWARCVDSSSASWAAQTSWYVDPVAGDDEARGADAAHPIKTLAELARRTGSIWIVSANVDVFFASYPPATDPLRLRVKFFQNPAGPGPVLTFHPPPLTQSSTGTLSGVTALDRAANVPWEVADGVVDTTGDVGKRIRITSGPNAGAKSWVGKSTGVGLRRTSTFAAWSVTNLNPTVVAPQVDDGYVIESSPTFLCVDFIEVMPGGGAPFPNMATLNLDGFDFGPIVANATTMIINSGCALDFANCAFRGGEWQVRTRAVSGDDTSSFTIFENCATFGEQNNLMFLEGTFIENYVWGGLYGGALWARQGGQFTVDFDALGQGNTLGGVPGLFVNAGSAVLVMTMGIMDMNAGFGAVVNDDGVVGCRNDFSYSGGFGLWGTSANTGALGMDVRSGVVRYTPGFPISLTGDGGDFHIGDAAQARAWDDAAGAYTANVDCTWANLFGGPLLDNAHSLTRNAHLYVNPDGNAQP